MSLEQQAETTVAMTTKASPGIAVVGAAIAGYQIADWVQILTVIYLILMITHKSWHMFRDWRGRKSWKQSYEGTQNESE